MVDLEVAIRWAQPADSLMGPAVIVVLYPKGKALSRLLEVLELCTVEELFQYAPPEALDLAQGHRVMRLAAQMVDFVLLQLLLEARLSPPGRVLASVVR